MGLASDSSLVANTSLSGLTSSGTTGSELRFPAQADSFTLHIYENGSEHSFPSNLASIYVERGTPGPMWMGYDGYDFSTETCEYYDVFFSDSSGVPLGIGPGDSLPDTLYLTIECNALDCATMWPRIETDWNIGRMNLDAVLVEMIDRDLIGAALTRFSYGLCDDPVGYKRKKYAWNILGNRDGKRAIMGGGLWYVTILLTEASPPVIVDEIEASALTSMRIHFYPGMLDQQSAEQTDNYSITKMFGPPHDVPITTATFTPPATVELALAEQIIFYTDYLLSIDGVTDTSGTPNAGGTNLVFNTFDDARPRLIKAIRIDAWTVEAVFSEPMEASGASTPGNYNVWQKGIPGTQVYALSAIQCASGDSVTLTFPDSLDEGTSYELHVTTGIRDRYGNSVDPDYRTVMLIEGVRPYPIDAYSEHLYLIVIVFSEGIFYNNDEENYHIYETNDTTEVINVLRARYQDSSVRDTILLEVQALKQGTSYTITINNLKDRYLNRIEPGTEILFVAEGEFPPRLLDAEAIDSTHVLLTFSKRLDATSAESIENYTIERHYGTNWIPVDIFLAALQSNGIDVILEIANELQSGHHNLATACNVKSEAGTPMRWCYGRDFIYRTATAAFFGLYADTNHVDNCIAGIPYYLIEMWVWCKPGVNGQIAVELGIDYPANVIAGYPTFNYDIIGAMPPFGSLPNGITISYNECQNDWNWPLRQLLVVTVDDQTEINIVEHSLTGFYGFVMCLEGYPTEVPQISSSLHLNCTHEELILIGAAAAKYDLVEITFNDPVNETSAETIAHYKVFPTENPADSIEIVSAERAGEGKVVKLQLEAAMTSYLFYTVRVSNVISLTGIEIAPNSEVSFQYISFDLEPPEVAFASIEEPHSIEILFNEPVDSAAAVNTVNYTIFPVEDSTAVLTITDTAIKADTSTVTLTTVDQLSYAIDYTLKVSGVTDIIGNVITAEGGRYIISESVPPSIDTVVVESLTSVVVTFSEELHASTQTSEYFKIYRLGIPEDSVIIDHIAHEGGGGNYTLHLADSLAIDSTYVLRVDGLMDLVGNEIAPGTEYQFHVGDVYPPVIMDAYFTAITSATVHFSEKLDVATAESASNYELFEIDNTLNTVDILAAVLTSDSATVDLALGDSIDSSLSYAVRVSNVEDRAGNEIAPASLFIIYETGPPVIIAAVLAASDSVNVTFSEQLDSSTASDPTNYEFFETSTPANSFSITSALLEPDGATVRLSLDGMLSTGLSYTVRINGVQDEYGNEIRPDSEIIIFFDDIFPPRLTGAMNLSSNKVYANYDERVDSTTAVDMQNYEVFPEGQPGDALPITAAQFSLDGVEVALTLGADLTAGTWILRVNNVTDQYANVIHANSEALFTYTNLPPWGFIGLYADDDHSVSEVFNSGGTTSFELWVWCLPGDHGIKCTEFSIGYPANVIPGAVVENSAIISVYQGDPATGISVCFTECQQDWFWCFRQTCYLTDSNPALIMILPHPDVGMNQLVDCRSSYPVEPMSRTLHLYLNQNLIPPATLLQRFNAEYTDDCIRVVWVLSALDEGIEFFISRAEGENGEYRELSRKTIAREGLTFTLKDEDIELENVYRYLVEYCINGGDRMVLFETDQVTTPALPLTLFQNYPNPFNPSTAISYYLPVGAHVTLEIFDVSGGLIKSLVQAWKSKGRHIVQWDGKDESDRPVSSGIYFYRLIAGKETISRKMILLK